MRNVSFCNKQTVRLFSALLMTLFFCLGVCSASAEAQLRPTVTIDSDGALGAALNSFVPDETQECSSAVREIKVDRAGGAASVSYFAPTDGEIVLRVYNDYATEEERTLLFTSAAVSAPAASGGSCVTIPLNGFDLPEYFELEADITADGETNTTHSSQYTEALVSLASLTPADFPEGYYVSLDEGSAGQGKLRALSAGPSAASENFVVYNQDLILLSEGTPYTREANSATLNLQDLPELTDEQLAGASGFVIRGKTIDKDVFLLADEAAGGIAIDGESVTVPLRAAPEIGELYEAVRLSSVPMLISSDAPKTVSIDDDFVTGTVSYTPALDWDFQLHGWKADFSFTLGNAGTFDLKIKQKTFNNQSDFKAIPDNNDFHRINVRIPGKSLTSAGVGGSVSFELYVAATGKAHVKGNYGVNFSARAGMSGVSKSYSGQLINFTEVIPEEAGTPVFVDVRWKADLNAEGGVLNLPLLPKIGPVLTLSMSLLMDGHAEAVLEKENDPFGSQSGAPEILHDCIYKPEQGDGEYGCISGRTGKTMSLALNINFDLYFVGTNIPGPMSTLSEITDQNTEYFYRSLKHQDGAQRTGAPIECPHKLYRFAVKTLENTTPLVGSTVSTTGNTDDWPWKDDRNKTKDAGPAYEAGVAAPLYLGLDQVGETVSAVDASNKYIAEAVITRDNLEEHEVIPLVRTQNLITAIDLTGTFPGIDSSTKEISNTVYAGTDMRSEGRYNGIFRVSSDAYGRMISECDGIQISAKWNGEEPQGCEEMGISTGSIGHVIFTVDFSGYDGGKWKLADDFEARIMGDVAGSPLRYGDYDYYFTITDVQVKNAQAVEISAEFTLPAPNDYCLVIVKNGLNGVRSHYYPYGAEAIAISQDVEGVQVALIEDTIDFLSNPPWTQSEIDALKNEVLSSSSTDKFTYWKIDQGPQSFTQKDFKPVRTGNGTVSYTGVTFTVPNVPVLVIEACYEDLMPPTADPEPGTYRYDLNVMLHTIHEDAEIWYYCYPGDEKPVNPGFMRFSADSPIPLYRAETTTQNWTIQAKTVRGNKESEIAEFQYTLTPPENEHLLIVQNGTAEGAYTSGVILDVPAGDRITLHPLADPDLEFTRWEVVEGPSDFDWQEGTGPETGEAVFNMPAQDVFIRGWYDPARGNALITGIEMHMAAPVVGDLLAKKDKESWFDVKLHTSQGIEERRIPIEAPAKSATKLDWFDVKEGTKVQRGKSYSFTADYTIKELGKLYPEIFAGIKADIQNGKISFSPNAEGVVKAYKPDSDPTTYSAYTSVSYDRQQAMLAYSFDFPLDYKVDVLWLDWDNHDKTRGPVTVVMDGGESKSVDGSDSNATKDENGVGISSVSFPNLSAAKDGHSVKLAGEENGYITISDDSLYRVTYKDYDGENRSEIILTAVRRLKAEKKWDIDFENKDRPDSVTAILQSSNVKREDKGLADLLKDYILHGSDEDRDAIYGELEKMTGVSIRGLSPEAALSKAGEMIVTHSLSKDNITDALKDLLKPDTNDSKVKKDDKEVTWQAHQVSEITKDADWKVTFSPVDRYAIESSSTGENGKLNVQWKGEAEWRVVEKSGKAPVENGGDAEFTVPAYTSLTGKEVSEHSTVYKVSYSTKGDTTTITNLAVEDHSLEKFWVLLGDAKKPDNVFALLVWQYDEEVLEKAQGMGMDIAENPMPWMPEMNPISGDIATLKDILGVISPAFDIIPFTDKIKIPMAIAVLNEDNDWHAMFRVKKYGMLGMPLKHEAAEICSLICQDILQYFIGVSIPIGINPIQGFASVSAPEVKVPMTNYMLDAMVNTWASFKPDPGPDPDPDPTKTRIAGVKVWDDEGDADGIRPDEITLHLWENGVKQVADITIKRSDCAETDGKGIWPWHYDDADKDKKYTVTEDAVPGYKTKIDGLNVVNTHEVKHFVSVKVEKIWDDENNRDGKRPEQVIVSVLRDGAQYKDVTLNKENNWTVTLTGCPAVGKYSVTESAVPEGYTVDTYARYNSGASTWLCTVTNIHKIEKVTLSGRKIWNDDNDKAGLRPEKVTLSVRTGEEKTVIDTFEVSAASDWKWSKAYPKKDADGKEILYTVTEEPFDHCDKYKTTYSGLDVINTLETDPLVTVNVRKVWIDESDRDGLRPEKVTVRVLRDGAQVGELILSDANRWSAKLTDCLPGTYAVTEASVPAGYTASTESTYDSVNATWNLTVTNTHRIEKVTLTGRKIWYDGNSSLRPESVTIHLLADEEKVEDITVNAASEWKWSREYPRRNADGEEIRYTVTEDTVDHYKPPRYSGLDVINTLESEPLVTVNVQKVWIDENDKDGKRPGQVTVSVLRDGAKYSELVLSEANDWRETLTDCPPGTYAVTEASVPTGYTASAEASYNSSISTWNLTVTNTNTNTPGDNKVTLSGRKIWNDGNAVGLRPESVTIHLWANGAKVEDISVNAASEWKWSRVKDKSKNGKDIVYTVTEDPVDQYTTTYSGLDVINTRTTTDPLVTVKVQKVWNDESDRDGLRPEKVTVRVLRYGAQVGELILSDANRWSETLTDCLPGTYAVMESPVPKGYTASANASYDDASTTWNLTVTNTHSVEKVALSGRKIWDDGNDRDGLRPESVTIRLLANGEEVEDITVNAASEWKWSREYPRRNADGEEIRYTVTEDPVDHYETRYSGLDVINSRQPAELVNVKVKKIWDDENNKDGKRPGQVTVSVLRDGAKYSELVLSEANGWSETLTDCPQGTYIVTEALVPQGYTAAAESTYDSIRSTWDLTVTNTHRIEKVALSGRKIWDDSNDRDGLRPESVTIRLWAGEKMLDTFDVTAASGWKWSGEYPRNNENGEIRYTVKEDAVGQYETTYSGLDVINHHVSAPTETMTIEIDKEWIGATDEYPEVPVRVQLMRNGEALCAPVELNADNDWTYEIRDLPRTDPAGEAYRYTVTEKEVPEGYAAEITYRWENEGSRLTCIVVNTHDGKILTGRKIWDDEDDRLGLRPSSVEFVILGNGRMVDRKLLTAASGWTWQDAYPAEDEAGNPISYSVLEMPVSNYTPVYDQNAPLNVTNKLCGSSLVLVPHVVNGNINRLFGYEITLQDDKQAVWRGTLSASIDGIDTLVSFSDGSAKVFLKDEEKLELYGIPDGWRYTVRAAEIEGYVSWVVDAENENDPSLAGRMARSVLKNTDYPEWTTAIKRDLRASRADFYHDLGVTLSGRKTVNRKIPSAKEAGRFTFVLYDEDGNELDRTVNEEDGLFHFDIRIGKAVERTYTIAELSSDELEQDYVLDTEPRKVQVMLTKDIAPNAVSVSIEPDMVTINNRTRTDPYTVPFTFTKEWHGTGNSHPTPRFTLYNADGTVFRSVQPSASGSNPTIYTYWLQYDGDYYVKEEPMSGYVASYANPKASGHEDVTDRVYNHGIITNTLIPKTGDSSRLELYLLGIAASACGIFLLVLLSRRKKPKN